MLSLIVAVLVVTVIFGIATPSSTSLRTNSALRLVEAARTGNTTDFDPLIGKDAYLWTNFDVSGPLEILYFRRMIGRCPVLKTFEGLYTVAVQFDCARDANGEFIVDFAFCGDKIQEVSWPETGRTIQLPVLRDLLRRATSDGTRNGCRRA